MSKSARLRAEDWRAILQLVGECRELGDEKALWRRHLLERLASRVGADLAFCQELAGLRAGRPADHGAEVWGFQNGFDAGVQREIHRKVDRDPTLYGALIAYFRRQAAEDGVSLSRREVLDDASWYRSPGHELIHLPLGVDHALYCFRSMPDTRDDASSGLLLFRESGRRDFSPRAAAIVEEAHRALAPLVGGPLARLAEPSPMGLPPRVRQVLACLLEGDSDKQVALRLSMSAYTVNEYTKLIYRHFGVRSRPELLAQWVRRGRGSPPAWLDD
ncbi:MAG: helix-turn-helix transcriptional regulator [Isosphaeraceae bacterium]